MNEANWSPSDPLLKPVIAKKRLEETEFTQNMNRGEGQAGDEYQER